MPKLTKTAVDRAEVRDREYWIWCSELPGFGVRVFPTGKRVYYVDYRNRDGGRKRMTIGPHGKLTTEEARKLALVTLGDVLKGEDPALERATRRKSLTVSDLCDDYLAAVDRGLVLGKGGRAKKISTVATDRGRIERHIKPLLGKRLVVDLQPSDVSRFIRDVTAGKTATDVKTEKKRGRAIVEGGAGTAARTAGLLGGILSYAVSEGVIPINPARGVKRPADKRRDRRLDAVEYQALGKAITAAAEVELPQAIAGAWLLAFTGCRLGEIESLRWSEVDLDGGCLRLADSKEGASVRPLPRRAIAILEGLDRKPGNPHVLPAARKNEGPYTSLAAAIARMAEKAKLQGVTAHTFRHSFASVGDDLGFTENTVGGIIGHAGTSTTSRYIHKLDAVLIAAANKIADEIHRQMTGEAGAKVVRLPGTRRTRKA